MKSVTFRPSTPDKRARSRSRRGTESPIEDLAERLEDIQLANTAEAIVAAALATVDTPAATVAPACVAGVHRQTAAGTRQTTKRPTREVDGALYEQDPEDPDMYHAVGRLEVTEDSGYPLPGPDFFKYWDE
jgi:hypothetical protein